ncbi:MAG: potassium transporter TrkG [Pseudomonadota bacterium]
MLSRVSVISILVAILGLMMLVPCIQAASAGEWRVARAFLYPAIGTLFAAGGMGVLLRPMAANERAQHELLTLLLAWAILPAFAALPLMVLVPSIGVFGAWFEMVAAITTPGGSVLPRFSQIPEAVHLWRGLGGWFGGLLSLTAAFVVLAPRRLGGFEVMAAAGGFAQGARTDMRVGVPPIENRVFRALRTILPFYLGATGALAIAFNALDKPGLTAAVHAMSIVSTSGISPLEEGIAAGKSFTAEFFAVVFMAIAATRLPYARPRKGRVRREWQEDPEIRLMLMLTIGATALLFLRHWVGALTIEEDLSVVDALEALWGAFFTSLSFLTTTGFESYAWSDARGWSGLDNPGLILICLCMIGGGAATTAGGIKLIRAYAMFRHGTRELERIASPHSVAGLGAGPRELRREGAFIAWAFMMLFILALMSAVVGLTLTGAGFENALFAGVAALSNTGPAYELMADSSRGFGDFGAVQQFILALTMMLGRIEALAFIALFNFSIWTAPVRG